MKVKIIDCLNIFDALQWFGNKEGILCNYQVAKNLNVLKPVIEANENNRRLLIDKYSLRDKDGKYLHTTKNGIVVFDFGNNQIDFDKEMEAYQNNEVDINLHYIQKEHIKDKDGKELIPPANVIMVLMNNILKID